MPNPEICPKCEQVIASEAKRKRDLQHRHYFLVMRCCYEFLPDSVKEEHGDFDGWRRYVAMKVGSRYQVTFDPKDFDNPQDYANMLASQLKAFGHRHGKAIFTQDKAWVIAPISVKDMSDSQFKKMSQSSYEFIEKEYGYKIEEIEKSA